MPPSPTPHVAGPEKEDEDEETHKIRQRVMLSVGGVSTAAVVGGCAYATYLAWPKDGKVGTTHATIMHAPCVWCCAVIADSAIVTQC